MSFDKKSKNSADAGAGFSLRVGDHATSIDSTNSSKTYLATVRLRFSEGSTQSYNFDLHRDRRDLVTFKMMQSEETTTSMHLGFSHGEGAIAGLRFLWHF